MSATRIFILDDDAAFRQHVRQAMEGLYLLEEASSEGEFRAKFRPFAFDLILIDMRLRLDREGMDVLRDVFAQDELQPVIMVSAYGDTESAIEAVGAGAMMFLHKREFTPALLGRMVEAVIEQGRLRRQVRALRKLAWGGEPETLLGDSAEIREASAALRAAAVDLERVPVVIGERGCGASLAARLIHRGGEHPDGPFVETNVNEVQRGDSFFEGRLSPWIQAAGGTLALDGVEAVSNEVGQGLLDRLNGVSTENTTHRVIFLIHEVPSKSQDRKGGRTTRWLDGVKELLPVRLPPLRERREDIPLLAAHFLQRQRSGGHTAARSISGAAMERLEAFSWPGNVGELRNAVEYAALQATSEADEIGLKHLPAGLLVEAASGAKSRGVAGSGWDYRLHLARTELELADRAIRERGIAQKTALAKALGYTDRFTLMRRIRKALCDYPALDGEFAAVANLFKVAGTQ